MIFHDRAPELEPLFCYNCKDHCIKFQYSLKSYELSQWKESRESKEAGVLPEY